jgi:four helix bundle suffix protein
MLCLIHQTNYLLDQQLRQLEHAFVEEGRFTERLYKTRVENRQRQYSSYKSNPPYDPPP